MSALRHSRKRWFVSFLLSIFVCMVGVAYYLVKKPQRDGELVLSRICRIEVGKTNLEQLKAMLVQSGPSRNADMVCQPTQCVYAFMTSNDLLRRLHMAPPSLLLTDVYVTGDVVSDIVVHYDIGEYGEFAHLRFVQGLAQVPQAAFFHCGDGGEEKCIKRYNDTDGTPIYIWLLLRRCLCLNAIGCSPLIQLAFLEFMGAGMLARHFRSTN